MNDDLTRPIGRTPTQTGENSGALSDQLSAGTLTGPFVIEELLGEGGMGQVYRARQREPFVREVALKLLSARSLSQSQLAMFEIERHMLAQMSHPAIAQIFDAGATADGRPWFAMEYVPGERLTAWCDARALPLRARIALFVRVCRGVEHAHQKGVIHRDLKPGNILVTAIDGAPSPKIIDFGIAVAAARYLYDPLARHIGTPLYMSPEQTGETALDLDTRSDIYSLGVVLHELLIGSQPTLARQQSPLGARNQTLTRPSVRLAESALDERQRVATLRGLDPQRLRRALAGGLDWVVEKATAHDREQRYSSAALLADDLEAFLADRPLLAVPPSARYRAGRFVRRHRLAFAAASAMALTLVIGLAAALYGLRQATAQRAVADTRSAELEQVSQFQQSMLADIDLAAMGQRLNLTQRSELARALQTSEPEPAKRAELLAQFQSLQSQINPTDIARTLVAEDVLERALGAIAKDFAAQPAIAADLNQSVGDVYLAIGDYARAERVYAALVSKTTADFGDRNPRTFKAESALAYALNRLGKTDAAAALIDAALVRAQGALGADSDAVADLNQVRGLNLSDQGQFVPAIALLEQVRERQLADHGATSNELLGTLSVLGLSRVRAGEREAALVNFRLIYETRRARDGAADPATLAAAANLGALLGSMGRLDEALSLQQQTLAESERLRGADHPATLADANNLATTLSNLGRLDEALASFQSVYAARLRVLGGEHPHTLRSKLNVASVLSRLGREPEAIAIQDEVIAARQRTLGLSHMDTLSAQLNLASMQSRIKNYPAALATARAALAGFEATLPAAHPARAEAQQVLGVILTESGRPAEGLRYLMIALATLRAAEQPEPKLYDYAIDALRAAHAAGDAARERELRDQIITPFLGLAAQSLTPSQLRVQAEVRKKLAELDAPAATR